MSVITPISFFLILTLFLVKFYCTSDDSKKKKKKLGTNSTRFAKSRAIIKTSTLLDAKSSVTFIFFKSITNPQQTTSFPAIKAFLFFFFFS